VTESREPNSFSFGYPTFCSLCCNEILHARHAGYLIRPRLEAKPYIGSSPKVFLIGQDPTLANRQIETVLEFDREGSQLRRYIEKEILAPLGFTTDDVYATNAVKCTFPARTPAEWAKMKGVPVENILYIFFRRCKQYLTAELICLRPRIVIAFGQPTHRLLVSAYKWKISPDMKEVFGQVFPVNKPVSTLYVPAIHYNTRRHQYYQERWTRFLQEVAEHLERRTGNFPERVRMAWLRRLPVESPPKLEVPVESPRHPCLRDKSNTLRHYSWKCPSLESSQFGHLASSIFQPCSLFPFLFLRLEAVNYILDILMSPGN